MVVSCGGSRGPLGLGGSTALNTAFSGAGCFRNGGSAATKMAPSRNPSMIHDGVFDIFEVEIGYRFSGFGSSSSMGKRDAEFSRAQARPSRGPWCRCAKGSHAHAYRPRLAAAPRLFHRAGQVAG